MSIGAETADQRGKAGICVSGKTTRSALFRAASWIRPTVFCTVLAVSRKTGATLQADFGQLTSSTSCLVEVGLVVPATRTFGSHAAIVSARWLMGRGWAAAVLPALVSSLSCCHDVEEPLARCQSSGTGSPALLGAGYLYC